MIRITTNSVLRNYKSSLMRSSNALNDARETVLTQRNFNSYAEDPSSATQAFQLRRSYWRANDQLTNNTAVSNKFQSAWTSIDTVVSDISNAQTQVAALRGLNDATASGREALGAVLKKSAESVVQNFNATYGSSFLFAGSDGDVVPFSFDADTGTLLYRGLDVSSTDPAVQARLTDLTTEKKFTDIGLGLKETDTGELIEATAFDSSLPGISFLGYGRDGDGDPLNVVNLMYELGSVFSRCDPATGEYASDTDEQAASRLTDKLGDAMEQLNRKFSELDTRSAFLNTNKSQLTSRAELLNEQILSIEQCDLGDAITAFSWAQYCYNAALKAGNSILSASLMDYMN